MADERNRKDQEEDGQQDNQQGNQRGKQGGRDRVIGEGMNSLDSTQAPLKAETGEPDWDAMKGRVGSQEAKDESDRKSNDKR